MPMIQVTLPDGTVNEYSTGITAGEVVIDILGRKHGCVAAFIDDEQMDFSTIISENCSIDGISADSEEGIHVMRHSAAHLLAQAVAILYPEAKPRLVQLSSADFTMISPILMVLVKTI